MELTTIGAMIGGAAAAAMGAFHLAQQRKNGSLADTTADGGMVNVRLCPEDSARLQKIADGVEVGIAIQKETQRLLIDFMLRTASGNGVRDLPVQN